MPKISPNPPNHVFISSLITHSLPFGFNTWPPIRHAWPDTPVSWMYSKFCAGGNWKEVRRNWVFNLTVVILRCENTQLIKMSDGVSWAAEGYSVKSEWWFNSGPVDGVESIHSALSSRSPLSLLNQQWKHIWKWSSWVPLSRPYPNPLNLNSSAIAPEPDLQLFHATSKWHVGAQNLLPPVSIGGRVEEKGKKGGEGGQGWEI